MPECAKCGKEFDSERGLKVHNSQVHEDDPEVIETKKEANVGNVTLRLNYRHALVIVFGIGILTGGFATTMMFSVGGMTGMLAAGDTVDTGDVPSDAQDAQGADDAPADDAPSGDDDIEEIDASQVELDGQSVLGDADAPVTVVSYEDFFCPFCGQFNNEVVPQIMEDYVESGDVKMVYKHLPVVGGELPALASECVAEQDDDAFWEYKEALYADQERFSELPADTLDDELTDLAGDVGVDVDQFTACYEDEEAWDQVQADAEEAQALGARGTPTVLVNDNMVRGAQPYPAFQQLIEDELAG